MTNKVKVIPRIEVFRETRGKPSYKLALYLPESPVSLKQWMVGFTREEGHNESSLDFYRSTLPIRPHTLAKAGLTQGDIDSLMACYAAIPDECELVRVESDSAAMRAMRTQGRL